MIIGIYCYPIADILAKKNSKIFIEWSSTKHTLLAQTPPKRLNLLKIFKKINSSEAIRTIKLKLFGNVRSISLYKNIVFIAEVAMAT